MRIIGNGVMGGVGRSDTFMLEGDSVAYNCYIISLGLS